MQAIQDAEDIDTGVDTRTKEEMLAEQMSDLKSAGKFLKEEAPMFIAESTPGLGEAIAIKRTSDAIDEEDYVGAGIEATAGVLGMVPIIGDAAGKTLRTTTKSLRKGYNPEDPKSRVFHLTKKDFDAADVVGKGTNDIGFHVGTAAQATSRGSTNINYDKDLAEQMVKDERILPMVLKNTLKPARIIDVGSFKEPKNWIANLSVAKKDKQLIKFLLDDPADADLLAKAPRVTVGGDTYYMLPDAMRSGIDEKLWKDIIVEAHEARRVGLDTINKQEDRVEWFNTLKQTANKNGYDSFVYKNEYEDPDGKSLDALVEQIKKVSRGEVDPSTVDMTSRYDDSYMLLEPDQAKGLFGGMTEGDPRYMKNRGGLMLQSGGAVPMKNTAKQMEMFDEGGLKDEGGTVDPVSGNDVPPGSTQEEVRDDIPAQLSEGEFVFPADVVRYIGLSNLMRMRQEAKMGLKLMEEMGQMGNSDEATMPDDLPFDINDLDMEDELEYNEGGFVPGTLEEQQYGIRGRKEAAEPTTGVAAVPQQAASQQYVKPVQAEVPTTSVYKPAEVPTFKGFVGENVPGVDFEYVEYKNEAGNVIKLRKSKTTGELLDPVPEGYTFIDPEAIKTEEVTTTPTTPQTTTVREDKGDADDAKSEEEKYGPGGGRLGIKGDIYGVSFDGINPLTEGRSLMGNLITGGMIPADLVDKISVNLQNPEYGKFTVTGQEYNAIKQSIDEFGANSTKTNALMENLRLDAKKRELNARTAAAQRVAEEVKKEEKRVKTSDVFKDSGFQETGGDESVDTSSKGAALEASLRGSPTPSGTGKGRQDYSGGYSQDETSGDQTSQAATSDDGFDSSFSSQATGDRTSGRTGFNQGGLASKPKPKKTKKMKKGGLASKK